MIFQLCWWGTGILSYFRRQRGIPWWSSGWDSVLSLPRAWVLSQVGKLRSCKLYMRAKSLQSCLTLCDPMEYSLPGSSVHGILQARVLEWVAMPSSRGSSQPRGWTQVSCIGRSGFFTASTTWEAVLAAKKKENEETERACLRKINKEIMVKPWFCYLLVLYCHVTLENYLTGHTGAIGHRGQEGVPSSHLSTALCAICSLLPAEDLIDSTAQRQRQPSENAGSQTMQPANALLKAQAMPNRNINSKEQKEKLNLYVLI